MPGMSAMAVFSRVEDGRCLCFPASPPAALPGMLLIHTGDPGAGGAPNIPCSFLGDPACAPLPTAVEVSGGGTPRRQRLTSP